MGDVRWGYKITYKNRSGLPRSIITLLAAKNRLAMVIVSAILVKGRLQPASVIRRMADIRVPAWETPIKKTRAKLLPLRYQIRRKAEPSGIVAGRQNL